MSLSLRDSWLFFFALLSLSQSGNIAKYSGADVEILGFWRLMIAALIATGYGFYVKSKEPNALIQLKLPNDKNLKWIVISGFLFFVHLWTYKYSAQNTLIAHSMILFALNPLWTAIIAPRFLGDKLHPNVKFAFAFGFLGIVIIALSYPKNAEPHILGNLSALLSGFFYSLYFMSSKKARSETENVIFVPLLFFIASIGFGITGLIKNLDFFPTNQQFWLSIFALIAFPTFVGHSSMVYLVKKVNVNWLSCGKLIEVPLAAIVAYFAFGQELTISMFIAFGLAGASVFLLFKKV